MEGETEPRATSLRRQIIEPFQMQLVALAHDTAYLFRALIPLGITHLALLLILWRGWDPTLVHYVEIAENWAFLLSVIIYFCFAFAAFLWNSWQSFKRGSR